jgi:excinuclease ABC subunit B
VTSPDTLQGAIWAIQQDLVKQVDYMEVGKHRKAKRLEAYQFRFRNDSELGYCSGIENYSATLARSWHKTILLTGLFPKIS